jgi:hypothetical protein
MTEWQSMFDEFADEDLVLVGEDAAFSSSIRRKRPDAWAVHWGRRATFILESTRPNDGADDWQTRTDACKADIAHYGTSLLRLRCGSGGRWKQSPSPWAPVARSTRTDACKAEQYRPLRHNRIP